MTGRIPKSPSRLEAEGIPDPGFSDDSATTGDDIDAEESAMHLEPEV